MLLRKLRHRKVKQLAQSLKSRRAGLGFVIITNLVKSYGKQPMQAGLCLNLRLITGESQPRRKTGVSVTKDADPGIPMAPCFVIN